MIIDVGMEWNLMSEDGLLVDLKNLRHDYREGHSGMGHPSRGYYITTWRGMESLQSYATNEAIAAWSGDNVEFNVREVKVTDDGTEYEMRAWTDKNFLNRMNNSLYDLDESLGVNKGYWDKDDGEIHEAIINNIFGGQMDRKAVVSAMSNPDRDVSHRNTMYAMQYDIVRAQYGHEDVRAKAGAHAYQNVLARDAKLVNFDAAGIDDITSPIEHSFQQLTEDQWMQKASGEYIDYILDSFDGSTKDTVNVEDVKELANDLNYVPYGQKLADEYGNEKWETIEGYLKKDIMFFIDAKDNVRFELGMGYLDEVHDAVGVSPQDDLGDSFNEPYVYDMSTNSIKKSADDNYDDEWDLEL